MLMKYFPPRLTGIAAFVIFPLLPLSAALQTTTMNDVALIPDFIVEGQNNGDWLGYSVAISGDVLAVGVPQSDVSAKNAGEVQIWIRDAGSWIIDQTLVGSSKGDEFGSSVALDNNTLVVGAPFADSGPQKRVGHIQVWARAGTTWTHQQTLSGSAKGNQFGSSVALEGDTLIVGAPYADASGYSSSGLAHIYVRNGTTWLLQQTIEGSARRDRLGWSVALSGDNLAVGAPFVDSDEHGNVGQVQMWTRESTIWMHQQTLIGSARRNRFGWSVDLEDDFLLIGVPYADAGGYSSAGQAHVYVRDDTVWLLQQTIPGIASHDRLGWSVTLSGDTLAVGAPLVDPNNLKNAGAVQIWSRSGTTWLLRSISIGRHKNDQLGRAVALSNGTLVVGVHLADPAGIRNAGQALIFEGIDYPAQDGCYIDSPSIAFVSHPFPILIRCNNVSEVYGFEYQHSVQGMALQPLEQSYIPGDIFESAGNDTLILVNDIFDGYAVSLRSPASPVTGDFTLGSVTYDASTSGIATFYIDTLTLGDIYGHEIPDVIAPDPHITVTIIDPND